MHPRSSPLERRTYFNQMARDLMHVLDPADVSLNASAHGIVIYPRYEYEDKPSPWEYIQLKDNQPLPADWTGFLYRLLPRQTDCSANNWNMSDTSHRPSAQGRTGKMDRGGASTPTRRSAKRLGSKSDGLSPTEEGTTPEA